MNVEKHLQKAERIETSLGKLDRAEDWELIVEGIFGASQHYIASICEKRIGKHQESHKGLVKFLRENGLSEISNLFLQIDELRIGRWYGNKTNGETVSLAYQALDKIKEMLDHEK